MTTALQIIDDCLSYGLGRLAVGETSDSGTRTFALTALNSIVDELKGSDSMLFREALITSGSAVSSNVALSNSTWTGTAAGDKVLDMSWSTTSTGEQEPMEQLTMAQYHNIRDKTETGDPLYWAQDGASLFFLPIPTGHYLTIRVILFANSAFADTTTDYTLPAGYRSALADLLTEKLAPTMGGLTPAIVAKAQAARMRLMAQNARPAILDTGYPLRPSIIRGW